MKVTLRKRVFPALATLLAMGLFSACGSEQQVADGGIRGTGSSVGPVSGFGSVFVNGVKFTTDGYVRSDDGITTESQLDEGMILRVEGEWRTDYTGLAESVEYDDSLRGEIAIVKAWNHASKTAEISILGQTVRIDSQTVVKGKMIENVVEGDFARMSGWRMPNGDFRASYLGVRTNQNKSNFDGFNEVELEGKISQLNTYKKTFFIGMQLVNYGGAEFKGIAETDLADSVVVEVEGNLGSDGIFLANEIEPDDSRRYRQSMEAGIEFVGPVTSPFEVGTGTFKVNGLTVEVTGDTKFDDGIQSSDLVEGALIQVEGNFVADGTVKAEEISLRESDVEVEGGKTSAIDYGSRQLSVGGVLVQLTPLTVITDDSERRLKLSNLEADFSLEVEGIERENSEGQTFLEALKIEQDDDAPGSEYELTGRVAGMAGNDIRVLGVDMRLDSETEYDGVTKAGLQAKIDKDERPMVEVEYELRSGAYVITEIKLDEPD
ncbi:DUF5666 domain-containing protein [Marinobacter salexigens]|uniref:DUF5666 domain-containing protein n=1 Tax=Marinobacter salexigens TaxID=1925763 RepID=UPI00128FE09F|nr:DUF5666 domain-containing protein [Marinobacter salexigens]